MSLISSAFERLGVPLQGKGLSYVRNTGIVGVSTAVEHVLSYILILIISRQLGAEGLGQYSFIFAFAGFFFIFADWGLSPMMVKDLSRDFKDVNRYVSNILTFKSFLLVLIFLVYVVVIFFIGKDHLLLSLALVGIITVAGSYAGFFKNILRITSHAKAIAWGSIVERCVAVALGTLVLLEFASLRLFVVVLLASQLVKVLWYWRIAKTHYRAHLSFDWPFLRSLLKHGYPFIFIAAFTLIYVRLDTLMLSFMQGDVVTGWYNAGYKLINILNVVPMVLLTFGFPLFSRLFKENKQALRLLLERLLYYSTVLMLPIVVGVWFLASRFMEVVYDFNASQPAVAFQILIVAELFIFLTTILSQFIAAVDKQLVFAKIAGLGALLNIVLNLLLIPRYSLYGAGIATLITYVVMFVVMFVYVQKKILSFAFFKNVLFAVAGSVLLWFFIPVIIHLHLAVIVLLSAFVYGVLFVGYEYMRYKIAKKKQV